MTGVKHDLDNWLVSCVDRRIQNQIIGPWIDIESGRNRDTVGIIAPTLDCAVSADSRRVHRGPVT